MILIRGCRSEYVSKKGLRRNLKPSIQHGAWVMGPGTVQQLAFVRRSSDQAFPDAYFPRLTERMEEHEGRSTFFTSDELRALGVPIKPIPKRGLARWWWELCNDAGGAYGVYR